MMTGVSPNDAQSNFSSWLNLIGFENLPNWVINQSFDNKIFLMLILSALAFIIFPSILKFFKDEKGDYSTIHLNQKMNNLFSSNNQQNIQIGNTQRKLGKEFIAQFPLIKNNDYTKNFKIHCNASDPEALKFAMEIKDFFIKEGYEYLGTTSHTGITGGDGRCTIQFDEDVIHIIVGANIKSDIPLNIGGGLSQGLGKI